MTKPQRSWGPTRGKWKMGQIIKDYMREAQGPVPVGDLLKHLRLHGYHMASALKILDQFVDIDEKGLVHRKTGG